MFNDKKPYNMQVVFEETPVRYVAVQCPSCEKWFYGEDIAEDDSELNYEYQLGYASFRCPLCDTRFGCGTQYNDEQITETNYEEIKKNCMQKKVVWVRGMYEGIS